MSAADEIRAAKAEIAAIDAQLRNYDAAFHAVNMSARPEDMEQASNIRFEAGRLSDRKELLLARIDTLLAKGAAAADPAFAAKAKQLEALEAAYRSTTELRTSISDAQQSLENASSDIDDDNFAGALATAADADDDLGALGRQFKKKASLAKAVQAFVAVANDVGEWRTSVGFRGGTSLGVLGAHGSVFVSGNIGKLLNSVENYRNMESLEGAQDTLSKLDDEAAKVQAELSSRIEKLKAETEAGMANSRTRLGV